MFVTQEKVAVTLDGNTIYIRNKMDYGTRSRVLNAAASLDGDKSKVSIGAYQLALLQENITGWDGPDFAGVPYSREAVEQLDPNEPLVEKVLEQINIRNTRAEVVDPKSTINTGDLRLTANDEPVLELGTPISHSQNVTIGRKPR